MNLKTTKLCLTISLLFVTIIANSQSIIRSSINCFGSSYTSGSLLVRQTAGQPSNTESFINGQQLRQGFQQPIATASKAFTKHSIAINLFPNPAIVDTKLTLSEDLGEYEIIVSDITGKRVSSIQTNNSENRIDCTQLPVGICIISVVKNSEVLATAKLVIIK